jgi:uncharacterized protein (TIGR03067 family)
MRTKYLLALSAAILLLAPLNAEEKGKEEAKLDPAKLVGTWTFVSGEKEGTKVPEDNLKKITVEIAKDTITLKSDDGKFVMKYSVDTKKSPARISIEIIEGPQGKGSKAEGIIALKGDELKLCYPSMGGEAPKDFTTKKDSKLHLFVLKQKK